MDKRGAIASDLPPILTRLEIAADAWLKAMRRHSIRGRRAPGAIDKLQSLCKHLGQRWLRGMRHASPYTAKLQPT